MPVLRRPTPVDCGWLGLVLIPYVVLLLAVSPAGEFPLLDDFDYSASAWHLAETGNLRFSDWPAMTLVTHVAWGALASKIGGNSFAVLRVSMCVLSWIGAVAIYCGARRFGHTPATSALAATTFAVYPVTVEFQYTFMTDITGAALSAVLIAGSPIPERASFRRLITYSVIAGLAYLARETAAIPWIMLLAATGWQCVRKQCSWMPLVWLTLPAVIMIAGYEYWLRAFHEMPFNRTLPSLDWTAPLTDPARLPFMLSGLGLALFPIATLVLATGRRNLPRRWMLLPAAIAVAAVILVCCGIDVIPPYRGDIFDCGLRVPESPIDRIPASWRGPTVAVGGHEVSIFRLVTTAAGWCAATGLVTSLIASRRLKPVMQQFEGATPLPIATLTCASMCGLYLLTRVFGDRYLLSMVPAATLMLAERLPPPPRASQMLAWSAAILMFAASMMGIQDAMARSRCFWEAANRLLQRGADPTDIDAGLAFGGMHRFNFLYRGEENRGPFWLALPEAVRDKGIASASPLTTSTDRWLRISFDDEPGYRPEESVPFESWLRSGEVTVYFRTKQPSNEGG